MASSNPIYARFLKHADLGTWFECLKKYQKQLPQNPSSEAFTEVFCICVYVNWFSSLIGEEDIQKETDQIFKKLREQYKSQNSHSTEEKLLVHAMISAYCGYRGTTKRLFKEVGREELPIEWALLILPNNSTKRAKFLKPYMDESSHQVFLPGLYFYASALLELNYTNELQVLLSSYSENDNNPLLIDLRGKLFELSGSFLKAFEVYRTSEWAQHTYRAFICKIISQTSLEEAGEYITFLGDAKLGKGMNLSDGEIGQAEIARTFAFTKACQWQGYNNWLVNFEMGKLAFRRRRHAEAEFYMKLSSRQAPKEFQLVVSGLRFTNLTWLGGRSSDRDLNLLPEIMECGSQVLEARGTEVQKASTRIWLYNWDKDIETLNPVFETEDDYSVGEAYYSQNNHPLAVKYWTQYFNSFYYHRCYGRVINFFYDLKFEHTYSYLIEIQLEESWEDFFALWELANFLLSKASPGEGVFMEGKQIDVLLSQLENRLEELSQSDFQNAIRSFQYFADSNRNVVAESLLRRAGKLAESPEEYLSVAQARRKYPAYRTFDGERLAIESLIQAEQESTNRFERLQIAKELSYFGQVRLARKIMEEEGIFQEVESMEPSEYILALQCQSPIISPEERKEIERKALHSLERDMHSGGIRKYPKFFFERLEKYTQLKSSSFLESTLSDIDLEEESTWANWKSNLDKAQASTDLKSEQELLTKKTKNLKEIPLFEKYLVWSLMFNKIELIWNGIKRRKPDVNTELIPIGREEPFDENYRSLKLSKLWRTYFHAQNEEVGRQMLKDIKEFIGQEEQLLENWSSLKAEKSQKELSRLEFFIRKAQFLLKDIHKAEEKGNYWPEFLAIQEKILLDIDHAIKQLDEYTQFARKI